MRKHKAEGGIVIDSTEFIKGKPPSVVIVGIIHLRMSHSWKDEKKHIFAQKSNSGEVVRFVFRVVLPDRLVSATVLCGCRHNSSFTD